MEYKGSDAHTAIMVCKFAGNIFHLTWLNATTIGETLS